MLKKLDHLLNEISRDVISVLEDEAASQNKMEELNRFLSNMPAGNIHKQFDSDMKSILSMPAMAKEFIKMLGSYTDPTKIPYSVFTKHPIGKVLHLTKVQGLGAGELNLLWLLNNSSLAGGNESVDVKIGGVGRYEVKDFISGRGGDGDSIDIGKAGKIINFPVVDEIVKTFKYIHQLNDSVLNMLGDKVFKYAKLLKARYETGNIPNEINKTDFTNLHHFYHEISKVEVDGSGYDTVTFRGANEKPMKVKLKQSIKIDDIISGKIVIETIDHDDITLRDIISEFRRIKYVVQPERLRVDLQSAVDKAVNVKDTSYKYLLFRNNHMVLTKKFKFLNITRSAIRIIETSNPTSNRIYN